MQEAGLRTLLCSLPHPLAVHFQDWLGQSVSFDFPYSCGTAPRPRTSCLAQESHTLRLSLTCP